MKLLNMVVKSVFRSKRRTILTVVSMTFSFLIFAVLLSITTVISSFHDTISALCLTVTPQEWQIVVPYNNVDRIKKEIEGVDYVMGFIPLRGYISSEDDSASLAAVDGDALRDVWPDKKSIDPAEYETYMKDKKGAIVSDAVLQKYGLKIGDNFTVKKATCSNKEIEPLNIELTVRAVSPSGAWGGQTYIHRAYVDELMGKIGKVNMIVFTVKSEKQVAKAIDDVEAKFPGLTCQRADQNLANTMTTFKNINRLMIPITIGIVIAIVIVAANSLAISIRARTMEIAILKTVGFTNGQVHLLILIESTLISLIGGVLGCLIAYKFFNGLTIPIAHRAFFVISGETIAQGVVVSGIIGLVSGFIPAYRASKLRIVDALRRVA